MKTTNIEQDEIQIKIDIIYSSLNKWRKWLEKANKDERIDKNLILKNIEEEEENLKYYKENHSEYFI